MSELTVYRNAVEKQLSKRISSSSDEDNQAINSNDEDYLGPKAWGNENADMIDKFIADTQDRYERSQSREHRSVDDDLRHIHQDDSSPEEKANKMIREAEHSRERIQDTPGKFNLISPVSKRYHIDYQNDFVHSSMVDESYQLVGSHLDEAMQLRIADGEYVDFAQLVPHDQVLTADDNRYEMIIREGRTYWVPAYNNEGTAISKYNRWEQAFWVFLDVYVRAHPHRASELVQYRYLIHTASQSFTWENVYMYDKDFRLHLAKYQKRSWAIILHQAWAVRLKDKIQVSSNSSGHSGSVGNSRKEICKHFNRGECNSGSDCRYEHRCSYCFKYGHSVINCRKLKAKRGSWNDRDCSWDHKDWYDHRRQE